MRVFELNNMLKRWGSALMVCGATVLVQSSVADNPIISGEGVCDGHMHVFGDRVYLFSTHDKYRNSNDWWHMEDWQLYSSADLINWRKEFVLKPEDTYIDGPWTLCFATDGATRNGKYYFYFSQGQKATGVAVSDSPEGPYVDALGKPLVSGTWAYDPTIFIEDDENQTPYLIWGANGYSIAQLNEDMISLAEEPKIIEVINWPKMHDGSYLHKKGDTYYLTSQTGNYGSSKNLFGPYTYIGRIAPFGRGEHVDHPTFFSRNNQDYFVGHKSEYGPRFRSIRLTYVAYKDDGSLETDVFIYSSDAGVGQYDANWKQIQAEWYYAASDGMLKKEISNGYDMRRITSGNTLRFPNIKNMPANAELTFKVANGGSSDAAIEVRRGDANGKLLTTCTVPPTEGWADYQELSCCLANAAGKHDLCFVFKGSGDELVRFDWFRVTSASAPSVSEGDQT